MKMTVYYINHYASPPSMGRGERSLHIARAFARYGHRCLIIGAGRHHLHFPDAVLIEDEIICESECEFYLLPTASYSGNSIGRLWNMVSFGRRVSRLKSSIDTGLLPRPDLLIASSPHPFTYGGARRLAKALGCPILFEERDLWPLSLIEVAGVSPWNPMVWWMRRIVRHACTHADGVASLLPKAHEALHNLGLPRERFCWIPNGIDIEAWEGDTPPLPEEHRMVLDDARRKKKMVVVYSGAHGPANDLWHLMKLPVDNPQTVPYLVVLIGDGPSKPELVDYARQHNCSWIRFLPPLPKVQLRGFLQQSDIGYIGLKDCSLFRYGVSPNKVFDYMMASLPVVWAIRAGNSPVEDAGAGVTVSPGDPTAIDQALRMMASLPMKERIDMGKRGKEYVCCNHSWKNLGDRYVRLCESLLL